MNPLLGRRVLRSVARLLVVALLVAQAAASAHACTPVERLAAYVASAAADEHGGCHDRGMSETGACLLHCAAADQSLDLPATALPPAVLSSLPGPAWLPESPRRLLPGPGRAALLEPPIPIRLGSFRS